MQPTFWHLPDVNGVIKGCGANPFAKPRGQETAVWRVGHGVDFARRAGDGALQFTAHVPDLNAAAGQANRNSGAVGRKYGVGDIAGDVVGNGLQKTAVWQPACFYQATLVGGDKLILLSKELQVCQRNARIDQEAI